MTYNCRIRHIFFLYDIFMSLNFYYMSLNFLNNIYILGLNFIYVILFSSDIYMLVIYLFYVTQKTYICYCSPWHILIEKSHNMHMFIFWSALRLDPCHHPTRYPSSHCHNGIIQVLSLGIMIMFQLRHHRETACHSQPSIITTWQTGVGGGPLTVAHSARQDMCQVTLYSKTYHPNSCQISRVDFFVLFLYPATEVWNYRRGCLLKQDMSAGDNANCCSGRLSIGNLQGHTPWVFFWTSLVEVDPDCVIQEKHINDSLVVRYFRASPVYRHVCFRQKPCFDPSPRCTFAFLSNHSACWKNRGKSQPRKFENLTLVACQRKHFRVFCMIFGCFYSC